jgi:hypothetical protein
MQWRNEGEHELRHSVRIPVQGVACVQRHSGMVCACKLRDVSLGGALVRGLLAPAVGEQVSVRVRMARSAEFRATARVVRARPAPLFRQSWFALEFEGISAEVEDAIHDMTLQVLEQATDPAVLVVHRFRAERHTLTRRLAARGWRTVVADTPLQALAVLEREADEIQWVVVGEELSQTSGRDLLTYIGAEHPTIGRILVVVDRDCGAVMMAEADSVIPECEEQGDLEGVVGDSPHWAVGSGTHRLATRPPE